MTDQTITPPASAVTTQTSATPPTLKNALARFASGVTIVTTKDPTGTPHGFTASSFCSVSLDPPLICVCLARSARSHRFFQGADQFTISFLRPGHEQLARIFASGIEDKFGQTGLRHTARGTVVVDDALAVLECTVDTTYEAGDHTMLLGHVDRAESHEGEPLVFFDRAFRRLVGHT